MVRNSQKNLFLSERVSDMISCLRTKYIYDITAQRKAIHL